MSSVTAKIWKRRCYPVVCGDETYHVRALSIADRRRVDSLEDVLAKSFFALARGLCDATGNEVFPREGDETDAAYAARFESLNDIPTDTFNELCSAIQRIGVVPASEVIAKN
jgi:hypothetical protein